MRHQPAVASTECERSVDFPPAGSAYTARMKIEPIAGGLEGALLVGCARPLPPPALGHERLSCRGSRSVFRPGNEVALFARSDRHRLSLRRQEPQAGLDCSGMVSVHSSTGAPASRLGKDIARQGRPIDVQFFESPATWFNTRNASFSHVGVYIGEKPLQARAVGQRPGAHRPARCAPLRPAFRGGALLD